ncbi:bacteriocin immunity protein [Flavobacterium psychrophilum]|jgi:hypothetical protein
MTREELIKLGKKIVNCEGTEQEINKMIELFDTKVLHPNGSNLFYYPENYNARTFDISKYKPIIEEVVDKCLNYKPIIL